MQIIAMIGTSMCLMLMPAYAITHGTMISSGCNYLLLKRRIKENFVQLGIMTLLTLDVCNSLSVHLMHQSSCPVSTNIMFPFRQIMCYMTFYTF